MKTVLLKTHSDQLKSYSGPVLVPVEDSLESLPGGECMAEIKKKRNVKNHKRYFSFVKQSFDMQDHYDSPEVWRKVLQLKAGHYDHVVTEKGKAVYLPKSINWDELDETEFRPLFNEVVNAFLRDYGKGLSEHQINMIIGY